MKYLLIVLVLISVSPAKAQNEITISELLAQGYEIVAAAGRGETSGVVNVFLQRRQTAFMCITTPVRSRCFDLNTHNN